jgi:energy-coupling factor transporter ATP-binding protein EcfA2
LLVLDEPSASLDVSGTRQVIDCLQQLRAETGITLVLIEHRLAAAAILADRAVILEHGQIAAQGDVEQILGSPYNRRRFGLRRLKDEPMASWSELLVENGNRPRNGEPLIELESVSAGYSRRAAIRDISFRLYPGEFVALVGENGAGKSTLALAMAGLLKPQRGRVRSLGGRRLRPGLDISLLFQDPGDQLFTDQVEEEIAFGPRNFGCFDLATHHQTLAESDLLDLRDRRPTALSLGQQQRTALGACLALRPRLLILDEPTQGQDWGHLEQLMAFLKSLNAQGMTLVLITHDYKLVHRYARRVLQMKSGRLVLDGHLGESAPLVRGVSAS